jgi:hypothetical protein
MYSAIRKKEADVHLSKTGRKIFFLISNEVFSKLFHFMCHPFKSDKKQARHSIKGFSSVTLYFISWEKNNEGGDCVIHFFLKDFVINIRKQRDY